MSLTKTSAKLTVNFMDNLPIVITKKPIKHVYFRLTAKGELRVSAPIHLSDRKLNRLIADKANWIEKKYALQQKQQLAVNEQPQFALWGSRYPIIEKQGKKPNIILKQGSCYYKTPDNWTQRQKERLLIEYYRPLLMQQVNQYIEYYQPIIGVSVKEARSKAMKTRWGSCNMTKQRLWFNVFLVKYPKACCEYVVVHEMTHLLERYHNRRFYQLVEKAMPGWQAWHNYLRSPPW